MLQDLPYPIGDFCCVQALGRLPHEIVRMASRQLCWLLVGLACANALNEIKPHMTLRHDSPACRRRTGCMCVQSKTPPDLQAAAARPALVHVKAMPCGDELDKRIFALAAPAFLNFLILPITGVYCSRLQTRPTDCDSAQLSPTMPSSPPVASLLHRPWICFSSGSLALLSPQLGRPPRTKCTQRQHCSRTSSRS